MDTFQTCFMSGTSLQDCSAVKLDMDIYKLSSRLKSDLLSEEIKCCKEKLILPSG